MDWFPVVTALSVAIVIREFSSWWFSSARSPQRTDAEDKNGERVVSDGVAQHQDATESSLAVSNVSQDASSSNASPDSPHIQETVMATQPERNRFENAQTPGQAFVFPGAQEFFNHAHDFMFYHSVMYNISETKEKVLQWLAGFTISGAEFDARGHCPSCHPGTRITILRTLHNWVDGAQRAHRMLWLHGPAGVGKSAIVQSLAEELVKGSKLGATFFFSRSAKRDNPAFVFPTLAYQLAVRIPRYKEYLGRKMIEDPSFVVECGTRAILLDGLDECNGEEAQALIVTLISLLSQRYPTAPLVWLIASRPEAHLQLVYKSDGVRGNFEECDVPANSDEGCRDVEKFLRAKFEEIHQTYKDLMPVGAPWPAEQDITKISKTSSGFLALATTVARYIEDPHVRDPITQLATVVSVTGGLEPGTLSTLHAFYSAILDGVPKSTLPILKLLLYIYSTGTGDNLPIFQDDVGTDHHCDGLPLVLIATLLDLQRHTVYGALRKLHSVIKVPPFEDSWRLGIKFYHASFAEYLMALPDAGRDHNHLVTKSWRGSFKILHAGSSSYGQRPVQLSWNPHLPDDLLDKIWKLGVSIFTHFLLPECPESDKFGHVQASLTGSELQNAFENIDFSALLFRRSHTLLILNLFELFDWLVGDAPPELVQPDLVKVIPLKDLNLSGVSKEKLAHVFLWTSHKRERVDGVVGPRRRQFYRKPIYYGVCHFTKAPPESLHSDWHNKTYPFKHLIQHLVHLRNDNPMMDVLMVGKGPSRRCVLICVEPRSGKKGAFFYVPYSR